MREYNYKHSPLRRAVALLLALLTLALSAGFVSCDKAPSGDDSGGAGDVTPPDNTPNDDQDDNEEQATLDYSTLNVSEYIKAVSYKDLKIELEAEDSSREDAVWSAILETVEIDVYPVDAVIYYFNQTKKLYMDAVDYNEEDYYRLLKSRGTDENKMLADAKEFVKEDLVFLYITQTEQISISDEEKQELFDKYVDKYVTDYGYKRIYVIANMSELIYESMLYDKTMEFLILNNDFEVKTEKPEQSQDKK